MLCAGCTPCLYCTGTEHCSELLHGFRVYTSAELLKEEVKAAQRSVAKLPMDMQKWENYALDSEVESVNARETKDLGLEDATAAILGTAMKGKNHWLQGLRKGASFRWTGATRNGGADVFNTALTWAEVIGVTPPPTYKPPPSARPAATNDKAGSGTGGGRNKPSWLGSGNRRSMKPIELSDAFRTVSRLARDPVDSDNFVSEQSDLEEIKAHLQHLYGSRAARKAELPSTGFTTITSLHRPLPLFGGVNSPAWKAALVLKAADSARAAETGWSEDILEDAQVAARCLTQAATMATDIAYRLRMEASGDFSSGSEIVRDNVEEALDHLPLALPDEHLTSYIAESAAKTLFERQRPRVYNPDGVRERRKLVLEKFLESLDDLDLERRRVEVSVVRTKTHGRRV